MNVQFAVYLIAAVAITDVSESLPQCQRIDKKHFPVCTRNNFTKTSAYLANDFYGYSEIMKNITVKLGNCSNYTNFILCSLYVPRCDEKVDKPLLPCRDVCEEFLSDCWDEMNAVGLNWLKALCGLLGTKETDPKCFKPTGFEPNTTHGMLVMMRCTNQLKNDRYNTFIALCYNPPRK